ncbi:MAG: hypothetical protein RR296_10495, partial [Clostridia bacterium]
RGHICNHRRMLAIRSLRNRISLHMYGNQLSQHKGMAFLSPVAPPGSPVLDFDSGKQIEFILPDDRFQFLDERVRVFVYCRVLFRLSRLSQYQ